MITTKDLRDWIEDNYPYAKHTNALSFKWVLAFANDMCERNKGFKEYSEGELDTSDPKESGINTLIIETASDVAEKLAGLEWGRDQRPENFWVDDHDGAQRMNAEAQEYFDEHYDDQTMMLYRLVNNCIKINAGREFSEL